MSIDKKNSNNKQVLFRNMLVGILLYSVVLGFFNDYTDILHTGTYSTTFLMAIVMQILTYLTYMAKDKFVDWLNNRKNLKSKVLLVFGVWLIIFLSKFIFLWVIEFVFRGTVEISGFFGLLLMVVILTVAQKLVEIIYCKLGDKR